MKAVVYRGLRDVITEEVAKPKAGMMEILVKVKACGICGSDLHTYKLGLFPEITKEVPQGRIPGHEFAGDVVEVGPGVEGIAVGDRVTALAMGAMAEYVIVTQAMLNFSVYKLPPEIGYEEAATMEPLATSVSATKKGMPVSGEQVVIYGAGIIGLGVIQCLKAIVGDFKKLMVVDVSEKRLEMARTLGATDLIDASKVDSVEKITKLAGQVPMEIDPTTMVPAVDLVYDTVGYIKDNPAPPAIEKALAIVCEAGRIVVVGAYEGPVTVDLMPLMNKSVKVFGSLAYKVPEEIIEALDLIQTKKVNRNILISHTFPLEKSKEAFETQLRAGESVKVIFTMK